MTEKKAGAGSMLRKVVKFVANPTTDWSQLNARDSEAEAQTAASREELRAMVERKRRNEFVRKREFDMLRRVRREGLTPEQAAALDRSSRLDDSEARSDAPSGARPGVKDKIDAIEQQMVGAALPRKVAEPPPVQDGDPTVPMSLAEKEAAAARSTRSTPLEFRVEDKPAKPAADPFAPTAIAPRAPPPPAPVAPPPEADMEVNEVVHDPELDEAVIAFANADFATAETVLAELTGPAGSRYRHAETWLTRFDLYRATGQQLKFDALATDFTHGFGQSPPQWISLPALVAASARVEPAPGSGQGEIGWVCPPTLDADAVARLESQALQLPMPWVFDWRALAKIDSAGAHRLTELMRRWATQELQMRWLAADRLVEVLQEQAPSGARDADVSFWLLRMEVLRVGNRVDQFDEAAIDYCMTFEVSPPSWEPARCVVRFSGSGPTTRAAPMSVVGDAITSFMESVLGDDGGAQKGMVQVATLELSGQLVGDVHAILEDLDRRIGTAAVVRVACTKLIRADFIAAGDLLNWATHKKNEGRSLTFFDAHRLVAHFFSAMGIVEHARVQTLQA